MILDIIPVRLWPQLAAHLLPRLLTPREVDAINRQCIKRVYDEFDREDHGRTIGEKPCQ